MTTLAGRKIRRHREGLSPKMTRAQFGALHDVSASTVQGWEEEGKRPDNATTVNRIAGSGIAAHADWYTPAQCARCERASDDPEVANCTEQGCPLAHVKAA